MKSNSNAYGIVLLIILIGTVLFTYANIFRTQGFQFESIALPTIMLVWGFTILFGTFWLRLKGKGFIFATGIKATAVGGAYSVDNDRIGYNVSIFRQYITNPELIKLKVGGVQAFFDALKREAQGKDGE